MCETKHVNEDEIVVI